MKKSKLIKKLSAVMLIVTMLTTLLAGLGTISVNATVDEAAYEPKNVLLISGYEDGGSLNASWRNPKATTLDKVTITDITDGANNEIYTNSSPTPGASIENHIGVTTGESPAWSLDKDKIYTYKLKFEFDDGHAPVEVVMSQKPAAYVDEYDSLAGSKKHLMTATDKWYMEDQVTTANSKYGFPTNVTIDKTGDENGGGALHIQTNRDTTSVTLASGFVAKYKGGAWLTQTESGVEDKNFKDYNALLRSVAAIETEKNYKFSYKIKADGVTHYLNSNGSTKDNNNWIGRFYISSLGQLKGETYYGDVVIDGFVDAIEESDTGDKWVTYAGYYDTTTQSGDKNLVWYLPIWDAEDIWLDDVKLQEVTTEGDGSEQLGTNLLKGGEFELTDDATSVTNAKYNLVNSSVTLTYTAPADSRYVRIYERTVDDTNKDNWEIKAFLTAEDTSVELPALATGKEYVLESQDLYGVFSDAVVPTMAEAAEEADYEPKNVLLISGYKDGGSLNASWRNPKATTLNKVTITDITDGASDVVYTNSSPTPGASIEKHIGISESTWTLNKTKTYTYKLKFEFNDGHDPVEIIMAQKPAAYTNDKNRLTGMSGTLMASDSKWTVQSEMTRSTKVKYNLPTNVTIDATGDADGGAALHIQTNRDTSDYYTGGAFAEQIGNESDATYANYASFLAGWATETTEKESTYKLSLKIKTKGVTYKDYDVDNKIVNMSLNGGYWDFTNSTDKSTMHYNLLGKMKEEGVWHDYTVCFDHAWNDKTDNVLLWYLPTFDAEDIWIDDVRVQKVVTAASGTTAEVLGDSIIKMSDFEGYTAANAVSGAAATPGANAVTISYTVPEDSKYVRIYEVDGSDRKVRAIVSPDVTSVEFDNLTGGTEYTYEVESQSMYGVFSTPVQVKATPVRLDYEVKSEYSLKIGETVKTVIDGDGTYTAALDVVNYELDNFKPAFIVALYKDDILVQGSFADVSTALPKDGTTQNLSASVTVSGYDSTADYEICAFFWDGFDTLKPLHTSDSWTDQ